MNSPREIFPPENPNAAAQGGAAPAEQEVPFEHREVLTGDVVGGPAGNGNGNGASPTETTPEVEWTPRFQVLRGPSTNGSAAASPENPGYSDREPYQQDDLEPVPVDEFEPQPRPAGYGPLSEAHDDSDPDIHPYTSPHADELEPNGHDSYVDPHDPRYASADDEYAIPQSEEPPRTQAPTQAEQGGAPLWGPRVNESATAAAESTTTPSDRETFPPAQEAAAASAESTSQTEEPRNPFATTTPPDRRRRIPLFPDDLDLSGREPAEPRDGWPELPSMPLEGTTDRAEYTWRADEDEDAGDRSPSSEASHDRGPRDRYVDASVDDFDEDYVPHVPSDDSDLGGPDVQPEPAAEPDSTSSTPRRRRWFKHIPDNDTREYDEEGFYIRPEDRVSPKRSFLGKLGDTVLAPVTSGMAWAHARSATKRWDRKVRTLEGKELMTRRERIAAKVGDMAVLTSLASAAVTIGARTLPFLRDTAIGDFFGADNGDWGYQGSYDADGNYHTPREAAQAGRAPSAEATEGAKPSASAAQTEEPRNPFATTTPPDRRRRIPLFPDDLDLSGREPAEPRDGWPELPSMPLEGTTDRAEYTWRADEDEDAGDRSPSSEASHDRGPRDRYVDASVDDFDEDYVPHVPSDDSDLGGPDVQPEPAAEPDSTSSTPRRRRWFKHIPDNDTREYDEEGFYIRPEDRVSPKRSFLGKLGDTVLAPVTSGMAWAHARSATKRWDRKVRTLEGKELMTRRERIAAKVGDMAVLTSLASAAVTIGARTLPFLRDTAIGDFFGADNGDWGYQGSYDADGNYHTPREAAQAGPAPSAEATEGAKPSASAAASAAPSAEATKSPAGAAPDVAGSKSAAPSASASASASPSASAAAPANAAPGNGDIPVGNGDADANGLPPELNAAAWDGHKPGEAPVTSAFDLQKGDGAWTASERNLEQAFKEAGLDPSKVTDEQVKLVRDQFMADNREQNIAFLSPDGEMRADTVYDVDRAANTVEEITADVKAGGDGKFVIDDDGFLAKPGSAQAAPAAPTGSGAQPPAASSAPASGDLSAIDLDAAKKVDINPGETWDTLLDDFGVPEEKQDAIVADPRFQAMMEKAGLGYKEGGNPADFRVNLPPADAQGNHPVPPAVMDQLIRDFEDLLEEEARKKGLKVPS